MIYRKLRIAWSVAWGVVAVLLCVLWVRSYWVMDYAHCPLRGENMLIVQSIRGRLTVGAHTFNPAKSGIFPLGWGFESSPMQHLVLPRNDDHPQFSSGWDQYGVYVQFPYWLGVFVSAGFAAVSWLRWSHQFSLRTLLIATTLIALGLGWIVYVTR
jgi:hypothetical protein